MFISRIHLIIYEQKIKEYFWKKKSSVLIKLITLHSGSVTRELIKSFINFWNCLRKLFKGEDLLKLKKKLIQKIYLLMKISKILFSHQLIDWFEMVCKLIHFNLSISFESEIFLYFIFEKNNFSFLSFCSYFVK